MAYALTILVLKEKLGDRNRAFFVYTTTKIFRKLSVKTLHYEN
jgi:hypothetical protein